MSTCAMCQCRMDMTCADLIRTEGRVFCGSGCSSIWRRARFWTLTHEEAKAMLEHVDE